MPLGMEVGLGPMEVGLGPGDFVLDGDPAPPPLKGHSPQFSANGQTAGWTNGPNGCPSQVLLSTCKYNSTRENEHKQHAIRFEAMTLTGLGPCTPYGDIESSKSSHVEGEERADLVKEMRP